MEPLRAVIYCRCSTDEETQRNALEQQVLEARHCVGEQGWDLCAEYIEAKSGTTASRRPEYNRMCTDMESDMYDVIVIKSLDRLSRNVLEWYRFLDRMLRNQKRMYLYLDRKFYTPEDSLITGIKAILAEEYSRELSKKENHAHLHRQESGKVFILPPQTYGLKREEDGSIQIVEEEAKAIRMMFHMAKEEGCIRIAHYLRDQGYRNRQGKEYSDEAVRRIIRNPLRCGTVVQNTRHYDFETKRQVRVPREQWVVHRGVIPAIVSEQEWEEANRAMDERAIKQNPGKNCHGKEQNCYHGKNPGKYQLSGKIICGECGKPYYRRSRKRHKDKKLVVEWKCKGYIENGRNACSNIHLDEEALFHLLEKVCARYYQGTELDYGKITKKAVSILKQVLKKDALSVKIGETEREIEKYEEQKKRLLDKLLAEIVTDEDYKIKSQEIQARIGELNTKKEELKQKVDSGIMVEQRLQRIRENLEKGTVKEAVMTEMIDSIQNIRVYAKALKITFRAERMLAIENLEIPLEEDFLYNTRKEAGYRRVMEYMKENPRISARQIAEKEGISLSAANYRIKHLRKKGLIQFDRQGGHGQWIVKVSFCPRS